MLSSKLLLPSVPATYNWLPTGHVFPLSLLPVQVLLLMGQLKPHLPTEACPDRPSPKASLAHDLLTLISDSLIGRKLK